RTEGEHRLVVVGGLPAHHYSATDAIAEAYAMVFLVDAGYATQREVARAFRCSASRQGRLPSPTSHRTGLVDPTSGSSGRRGSRPVSYSGTGVSTRSYPNTNGSCCGAVTDSASSLHRCSMDTRPRAAKYAFRSARSTAGLWLRAHRALRPL